MSGDSGGYAVDDLLALGAAAVLAKPLHLAGLVETLRQLAAG